MLTEALPTVLAALQTVTVTLLCFCFKFVIDVTRQLTEFRTWIDGHEKLDTERFDSMMKQLERIQT